MRLYFLKLKDKPLYFAAKMTRALTADIEYFLHPAKHRKEYCNFDLQKHLSGAKGPLDHSDPAFSRALSQLGHIAAYLDKIRFDARGGSAQSDEYIRHAFFQLQEALELIYRDLTALRKKPASGEIKLIAAGARKNLYQARRQAAQDDASFIGNLKFDSICISLDKCFDSVEKYFDELAGIRNKK